MEDLVIFHFCLKFKNNETLTFRKAESKFKSVILITNIKNKRKIVTGNKIHLKQILFHNLVILRRATKTNTNYRP